jgi:hypothetical protein
MARPNVGSMVAGSKVILPINDFMVDKAIFLHLLTLASKSIEDGFAKLVSKLLYKKLFKLNYLF